MRFRHAIIVGASSGIGAELAKQLAAKGCRVALIARRESELNRLSNEINSASSPQLLESTPDAGQSKIQNLESKIATHFVHDVTCYEEVPALFQTICRELGGLDLLIYSSGVMPLVAPEEFSFSKDQAIIEVNVLGAIAWINEAAQRFAKAGEGTIVGISSVAGDRGRRGNPVYGASKAALDHYLEAVRNRVSQYGVAVVNVKPGPVDTPMSAEVDKRPLLISAPEAARQIIRAAENRAH